MNLAAILLRNRYDESGEPVDMTDLTRVASSHRRWRLQLIGEARPRVSRGRRGRPRTSCSDARDLAVYYGGVPARSADITLPIFAKRDHRADRPVRLRQDHVPALPQPDERPDRRARASRARSSTTASTCTTDDVDPVEVRRRIGMVFQKPNPFPKSIYDNVAFGPKIAGFKGNMDELVEECAAQRGALGRGEGQAEGVGPRRSRAASSSGSASPGRSRPSPT